MKPLRSCAAVLVAVLTLLVSAMPALAQTPPEGVVGDAEVTVSVTAADSPVAGADVTLEAVEGGEALHSWVGTTGEDGTIVFVDVWRPDAGGPALVWQATVARAETRIGAAAGLPLNCRTTATLDGSATVPAGEGPATIDIAATEASSVACGLTLAGTVFDSDGAPFEVAEAFVIGSDDELDWQIPFEVDADGAFTSLAPPTSEVSFFVRGADTRDAFEEGCTYTYQLIASATIEPDPETPVELVAGEERVSGSCRPPQPSASAPTGGGIPAATPPLTGGGAPRLTPPATDASAATEAGPGSLPLVLAFIGVTSALLLSRVSRTRAHALRRTQ